MKNLLLSIITISLLSSCALDFKEKKKKPKDKTADGQAWQSRYYEQTVFKLKSAMVVDSPEQLDFVCKGANKARINDYQSNAISSVLYKKTPINIKTKSGFTKKAYITRGVCRELALSKKKSVKTGIRKSIKSMNLLYIYNVGTFVIDLTFKTKFNDVEFYIK